MANPSSPLTALRGVVASSVADEIADMIQHGADHSLNRINSVSLAQKRDLDETEVIDAFLHATRLGLFELSWNVVCPVCGGILLSAEHMRDIKVEGYDCALCAAHRDPVLDDSVEVTFTVSPHIRSIAAHHPETLSFWNSAKEIYWSSGVVLPENFSDISKEAAITAFDLSSGQIEHRVLDIPEGLLVVFDPVTHSSTFFEVDAVPSHVPQTTRVVLDGAPGWKTSEKLHAGKIEITVENRTSSRTLPIVWRVGDALRSLVGKRVPTLSAKRLLSNQTFRTLFGAQLFEPYQRFEIKSLTFLFSDIKGSTALYEQIGDLAAYDLVRVHFHTLRDQIAACGGSVVKTMGDAVMATFADPVNAVTAALRIYDALKIEPSKADRDGLHLKMGIHSGPCLAVNLEGRQDYFGQTVNIASRIESAAQMHGILTSKAVAENDGVKEYLASRGATVRKFSQMIRGLDREIELFEIAEAS
jgi:class 3 adenylate cyclase